MASASDMAAAYESGDVDFDRETPATGNSGKNRSKTEQVRCKCGVLT